MKMVTATDLARNFSAFLDQLEHRQEELIVVRNNQQVARIIPGTGRMTALEAMADLYRTIPEGAAVDWVKDARNGGKKLKNTVRDPWAS